MKKHNARIGKDRIKDELRVTEDEVEGVELSERDKGDKEVDTKCESWRWKKKEKIKWKEKRREWSKRRRYVSWLAELLLALHEGVSCMEWELLMNASKVIAIKWLFSKAVDLFKADMCVENCLSP